MNVGGLWKALIVFYSAGPMTLLLMGYGMAWAIEDRFGIPRAALFGSALDLFDLGFLPASVLFERLVKIFGEGFELRVLYGSLGAVCILLLIAVGLATKKAWLESSLFLKAKEFASQKTKYIDQHHRLAGLLVAAAFAFPLVVWAATKLILFFLVVPLMAFVIGINNGLAYIEKYVISPAACSVSKGSLQAGASLEEVNAALCVALDKENQADVVRGRLVVATQKAYVLRLEDSTVRVFKAELYTPRPIALIAKTGSLSERR